MTFSLPVDVAETLLKRVPSRLRSSYVSAAITTKLSERETRLRKACEAANADVCVEQTERDWDTLNEPIAEPWIDAETR